MKRLIVALAATAAAAVAAAPAPANVPQGNGLDLIPAIPFGAQCEDGGTYSVLVTRNLGKSGWQVESSRHYVVGAFWMTTYFNGVEVSSDGGSWGAKAGLEPLECWGYFADGSGLEVVIESTIYPVRHGGS